MKSRFFKLILGAATAFSALLATSCEEEIPFIILDQEAVIVGTETEKVNIDVRANIPWTATSEADWCHVYGDAGNYKGSFEVLVDANTSVNSRVATITVAGEGAQVSLIITQSGSSLALTVPVPEYSISNEAQPLDIKFLVTSQEVVVDAISEAMWAEVVSVKDGTCKMQIAENKTGKDREAAITFVTSHGNKPAILGSTLIKQSAKGVLLVIPVEEYVVSNASQRLQVKYTITDEDAKVEGSSNCNWIAVAGAQGGVVDLTVSENATGEARTGVLTLVTVTTAGEAVTATTTINQAATENILDVVVDSVAFAPAGETITVPVVTNATITASCTSDWVTAAVKDNAVAFTAVANKTKAARLAYATITISSDKGKPLTKKVTLTQEPVAEDELSLPVAEISFLAAGGKEALPYKASAAVTVKSSSDWCTAEVKGSDIVVTAKANDTDNSRKAYVTVTTENGTAGIITVLQECANPDVLEIPVAEVNFDGAAETIKVPYASDAEVTVKTSSAWLTAAVKDNDIEISATENAGTKLRQGYVTLTTAHGTTGIITVNQAPVLVNTEELTLLVSELRVSADADSYVIPFAANSAVTARSNKEWCTVTVKDNDVTAKVAANTGDEREAFITLTTKTGVSGIIHLYQDAADEDETTDEVTVLVEEVEFTGDGGSIKVPYTAETEVAVRTSSPWITAAVSGSDVEITVPENWSGVTRKGYVTLQTADLYAAVITVIQESNIPEMSFNVEELTVDYATSTNYLPLTASGNWKLDNTADQIPNWITITPDSGEGNAVLTIVTKTNKFARSRSTHLSFTNTDSNISTVLTVTQDANPNGITDYKHLGRGYDTKGKYAEESGVKASVLDCDLLADGNHIADILNPNSTDESISSGKTRSEFENSYSAKVGVSGSYQLFTASVEANFSLKALGTEEYSFATLRSMTKKQILKIYDNETAADLKSCVSEGFTNDLKTLDAKALVSKYGTHVITGFSLGGVLEYSMAADASESSTEINWGTAVKAGFEQEGVGGASAEASYDQLNSVKNSVSGFESTMSCRGGQSQYTSNAGSASDNGFTASEYSSWLSSLEDANLWVMVDYEGSKLIPLWEFIDDATLAASVEEYITKTYLVGSSIPQGSDYTSFALYFVRASNTHADGISDDATEWRFKLTSNMDNKDARTVADYMSGDHFSFSDKSPWSKILAGDDIKTSGTYSVNKNKAHSMTITISGNNLSDQFYEDDGTNASNDKYSAVTITLNSVAGNPTVWTYIDSSNKTQTVEVGESSTGLSVDNTIQLLCASDGLTLYFKLGPAN